MATPNKVSIQVLIEILRRWEAGETVLEISKALSLYKGTVSTHLRRALGIDTPEAWLENGGRVVLANPKRKRTKQLPLPVQYPDNPPQLTAANELVAGEADRFWRKVAAPNERGCRLWQAATFPDGSGEFGALDTQLAYRVAWRLTYGPIPENKQINHRCDVRACVEPTHLWLGTQAENMADMAAKGRRKGISGISGEDNATAKINWKVVREIRTLRERDGMALYKLASKFGISRSQVHNIITYKQWLEPVIADDPIGIR
jgi:hypothetical protein